MRKIAIIPARSGSKRLKDKNIKLINGKPLMAYSILAALDSGLFDEVMVSTDSYEYAEIAKSYGASVPFIRDFCLAEDETDSWDVVRSIINKYMQNGSYFDIVALLQPTSPLRDSNDVKNAMDLFDTKQANAVVSVCVLDYPLSITNFLDSSLSMKGFVRDDCLNKAKSNCHISYRINGAIYIVKTPFLMRNSSIYSDECYAYIMDRSKSVDIDVQLDFDFAEFLMRKLEASI